MMRTSFMALIACLTIVLLEVPAAAQTDPLSWKHEVTRDAVEVVFTAHEELTGMEVVAKNLSTGRTATFKKRGLQLGEHWRVRLQKPKSATAYRIDFRGLVQGQSFEGYYTFSAGDEPPPDFKAVHTKFEENLNELHLVPTQAIERVQVRARGEQGQTLTDFERVIQAAAGSTVTLDFETAGPVLDVDVTMITASGASRSYRYTPWAFSTESRGLNFATGSATIAPEDMSKLEKVFHEVQQAVQEVGNYVDLQLYIGGYTDTVGSASSNDALSRRRAIAIAEFMKARGVSVPIFIQGFGERALAVPTPDNVDEPANRRAVFIVRANPPPTDGNFPATRWERAR